MISIIVAIASNGAIGRNNQLLWNISEDLRYFKKVTGGHTVIMGRKTWESIGRPLPNRRNIVVSKSMAAALESRQSKSASGIEIFPSLEDAIFAAENPASAPVTAPAHIPPSLHQAESGLSSATPEIFIIGGGEIYGQALPLAGRLYLTQVHTSIEGADTFFPPIDFTQWREVSRESFPRGEKFESPFDFVVLERI